MGPQWPVGLKLLMGLVGLVRLVGLMSLELLVGARLRAGSHRDGGPGGG
jgi:hypothetical protein